MRILIAVLLFLMVPGVAMSARWEKDTIPVWDYTDDAWRDTVVAQIDEFNAVMPQRVPRIVYHAMTTMDCQSIRGKIKDGGISLCMADELGGTNTTASTSISVYRGVIVRSRISLLRDASDMRKAVCEEMMHAVTLAPDAGDRYLRGDQSCVQGTLSHLGPWDVAYAERVYHR